MEVTHSKGLMYPALQLSSFRVRRDSLPPAFHLPDEVTRAVQEPLPKLRSVKAEQEAVQRNLKLLEEGERERKAALAMIEREAEFNKREAKRQLDQKKQRERESAKARAEKADKVQQFRSITGEVDVSAAEARLERSGWDLQKAVQSFFGD